MELPHGEIGRGWEEGRKGEAERERNLRITAMSHENEIQNLLQKYELHEMKFEKEWNYRISSEF